MRHSFDIVVSGGGLVGASFAAALARAGVGVAVIEPAPPRPVPADRGWDARLYAVSPGSAAFLDSCGAWNRLAPERVTRVETMAVHGDAPDSGLTFSAYDAAVSELAFIVEGGRLQQALWDSLKEADHVRVFAPTEVSSIETGAERVAIDLADGTALSARLLVGADGAGSVVRARSGIAMAEQPYGQSGVVANFSAARPHEGTAHQWFRAAGVLALLPMGRDHVSMVWSTDDAHAQALLAAPPDELARRVTEASRGVLGELAAVSTAVGFPLRLARASRLIAPRVALIGDAAHNVHPLAGQGVNLGFRDARELAAVLAARGAQRDCGDTALLRRYERARREDILVMQAATDGLQKLFARDAVWIERLRNAGLRMTDRLPPLKNRLIRHAIA